MRPLDRSTYPDLIGTGLRHIEPLRRNAQSCARALPSTVHPHARRNCGDSESERLVCWPRSRLNAPIRSLQIGPETLHRNNHCVTVPVDTANRQVCCSSRRSLRQRTPAGAIGPIAAYLPRPRDASARARRSAYESPVSPWATNSARRAGAPSVGAPSGQYGRKGLEQQFQIEE